MPQIVTAFSLKAFLIGTVKHALFGLATRAVVKFFTKKQKPAQTEQQVISQQSVPAQIYIFGQTKIASPPVFFREVRGDFLYIGYIVASHEIESVDRVFIGERELFFDGSGNVTNAPFKVGSVSFVQMSVRKGSDAQLVDPILIADFPELGSNFRQRGLATVVLKMFYGANDTEHSSVWGGDINFSAIVRGLKCFDGRISGASISDKSTWVWTDNAVLITQTFFHLTGIIPFAEQDLDFNEIESSAADVLVPQKVGSDLKFLTFNGVFEVNGDYRTIFKTLSCEGSLRFLFNEGLLRIVVDRLTAPLYGVPESVIVNANVQFHRGIEERASSVSAIFIDAEANYQQAETNEITDASLVLKFGERFSQIRYDFIDNRARAMRHLRKFFRNLNFTKTLVIETNYWGKAVSVGDIVSVDWEILSFCNGNYRVRKKTLNNSNSNASPVELELIEMRTENYAYDPETDELGSNPLPVFLSPFSAGSGFATVGTFSVTRIPGEQFRFTWSEVNLLSAVSTYLISAFSGDTFLESWETTPGASIGASVVFDGATTIPSSVDVLFQIEAISAEVGSAYNVGSFVLGGI